MLVNGKKAALSLAGSGIAMGTHLSAKLMPRTNGNINAPRVADSRSSFSSIQQEYNSRKVLSFGANWFVANQKEVKSYVEYLAPTRT